MPSDYFALRNRYLEQYKDIYGENIYLSSIELVENKISTMKGGIKLTAFYHLIKDCKDCAYANPDMNFGSGNENTNIIFIAESKPHEDGEHNNSLTGEAGQLFDKILSAIELTRKDVYISAVLKHTSFKNTNVYHSNTKICESHFYQHLQLINPTLVVALGKDVGNKILDIKEPIENLNGKIYKLKNFNLMVTYHPSEILKNLELKRPVWEDFKKVKDNYLN